ncbi:MAG: helicase HerA-like domain-containing protein [Acidimicrobiales bacterium]
MSDPSLLGYVQDVAGATVSVVLEDSTRSGLVFVEGHAYHVAQVGGFVRIPLGFTDLVGIVSQAGSGAVPERLAETNPFGRMWLTVQLIGEGSPGRPFSRGVSVLPSLGDAVHVMTEARLGAVYGEVSSPIRVEIGRIASASSIPALLDINALITRHSAVVGTTGAGKSTTVVKIVEAIADPKRYPSARVLIFDPHGEYSAALLDRAKTFRVGADGPSTRPLHVPYWALSFEELLPLTFGGVHDDASTGAIRDEIVRLKRETLEASPVAGVGPHEVTVDTPVPFSIHQLWLDLHRLLNATHTAPPASQTRDSEALLLDDAGNPQQTGDAITVTPPRYQAPTQAAGATKIFLSGSTLNIRRQVEGLASRLRDPRYDFLFRPGPWAPNAAGKVEADLDKFLEEWLGGESSVSILDLSGVPSEVLADLVGSLTRVIYESLFWSRRLSEGGRERPLLFVFEEAHAYLANRPTSAGWAVERVVKEGRKYGVGAMIVSQRPAEVDATILSQCGTVVALRLANATDRGHVASAVADNLAGVLSMLPILRTGEAIVIGEAVPVPMRVLVDLPARLPESTDPKVVGVGVPGGWDRRREPADYKDVVARWRSKDPTSARIVPNPAMHPAATEGADSST